MRKFLYMFLMLSAAAVSAGTVSAAPNAPAVVPNNAGIPSYSGGLPFFPIYPASAVEKGLEGTVTLLVLVAPDNTVRRVTIAKSSGHEVLDKAAEAAVRKGKYKLNTWTEFRVSMKFSTDQGDSGIKPEQPGQNKMPALWVPEHNKPIKQQ